MLSKSKGHLFVISAPSGTGKSTVAQAVCRRLPELVASISCTTRKPRAGERDGVDYYFLSEDEFRRRIDEGLFAEWASVHNSLYGTPKQFLRDAVDAGKSVILDIDIQGGMAIKKTFPEAVTVFLVPPDMEVLRERLTRRGTDDPAQVELRMANAKQELGFRDRYDEKIVNDRLEDAVEKLASLIRRRIVVGT